MSSLGIIIDGFYIDCLAPGNVINDRRHDEPPFFLSFSSLANPFSKGPFNNYVDKMRGRGGQKCLFLSTFRVLKSVHAREGVGGLEKWQNSVHVVVECPIMLPTQVQLGIRVLILKQARRNIKDRLRLILKKSIDNSLRMD